MTIEEMGELVGLIDFEDWDFRLVDEGGQMYMQTVFEAPDATNGHATKQQGRKWRISEHMTKSEFVQTAFLAVMTAVEHEVRENFHYEGEAVYGPHYDVDVLAIMAADPAALDVRDDTTDGLSDSKVTNPRVQGGKVVVDIDGHDVELTPQEAEDAGLGREAHYARDTAGAGLRAVHDA